MASFSGAPRSEPPPGLTFQSPSQEDAGRWVAPRPPDMTMVDPATLASWTRAQLIEKARELGVERPERMTRLELRDEIQRLTRPRGGDRPKGLLGAARSMLASMVEAGLNMPEAAAVIRGDSSFDVRVKAQVPVATVTLAEIYAVQGHRERALRMLDDVLAAEPDHEVARELRRRLEQEMAQQAGASSETRDARKGELVETTGEEIRTGQPPEVAAVPSAEPDHEPAVQEAATATEQTEEPAALAAEVTPEPPATTNEAGVLHPEAGATSNAEPPHPEPRAAESDGHAPQEAAVGATATAEQGPESDALFFRTDESGTRLYWELSALSIDRSSRRMPEGKAVIRVVAVHPDPAGIRRDQHDLPVEGSAGVCRVAFRRPAVVRAALGWLAPEGFHPFVVATDLDGDSVPTESAALSRARMHLDAGDHAS